MKQYNYYSFLFTFLFTTVGCSKLIEVSPKTQVDATQLFSSDGGATNAVEGIYQLYMASFSLMNGEMTRYSGLYADELQKTNNNIINDNRFYNLSLNSTDEIIEKTWTSCYNYIYQANNILENLVSATGISDSTKRRLTGESKFLRAYTYFYLVNLYGEIPLVLQTDPDYTNNLPRTSENIIFQQIIADLRDAVALLPLDYPLAKTAPSNRIRANKATAAAMLARVCLYRSDYVSANQFADWVINCGMYFLEKDLNAVFLAESQETILGFYPTNTIYNTAEGRIFGIPANGTAIPNFVLTQEFSELFEGKDLRLITWTKPITFDNKQFRAPLKYKVYESSEIKEYNIAIRLAEMYFIKAEAELFEGRYDEATDNLNIIRKRAQVTSLPYGLSQKDLFLCLEQEKAREYFVEWGHRWLDIRRWPDNLTDPHKFTRADRILKATKDSLWESYKIYWPLPKGELLKSSALTQNTGYN